MCKFYKCDVANKKNLPLPTIYRERENHENAQFQYS